MSSSFFKKRLSPIKPGDPIDYKDVDLLKKFITERGKILPPPPHRSHRQAAARPHERREACPYRGSPALRESRGLIQGSASAWASLPASKAEISWVSMTPADSSWL
jgi:hypothetical protein